MTTPTRRPLFGYLALTTLILSVSSSALRGEEPAPLELREWSLWLSDANQPKLNARMAYPSAMPGVVDSARGRTVENAVANVSPLSVITFSGQPHGSVDITLRLGGAGLFIAKWPPSEAKADRLRWLALKLTTGPGDGATAFVPDGHWFHQARQSDALHIQHWSRTERFLTYDFEVTAELKLRVNGGPDHFQVANAGKFPLHDMLMVVPTPSGPRIGWIDRMPAGGQPSVVEKAKAAVSGAVGDVIKEIQPAQPQPTAIFQPVNGQPAVAAMPAAEAKPAGVATPAAPSSEPATGKETLAEVTLSAPLTKDQLTTQAIDPLRQRLAAAGLKPHETALLLSVYSKAIFEPAEMVLLVRLPQSAIDELVPLEVDPETTKIVRVALVLCTRVSPQIRDELAKLIDALGDKSYTTREQAEKRLQELGRMAVPALKAALKNDDPERVMRAERLLLQQNERTDRPPN